MPKSFEEAFDEWKRDNRYQIGEDIGWEKPDDDRTRPTRDSSSLTSSADGD